MSVIGTPASFWAAPDDRTKRRLCIVTLLLVVGLVYGNTLLNGFTMDDVGLYIVRNPQVTAPSLSGLFSPHKVSKVVRPLTFATFALDWKLGGGTALGFHAVNVVLHAAVVGLVLLLLQTLLETLQQGKAMAFAAALLFAVHPIHTEAVTSIVGRAELLAAGFLVAAWILHLQNREIPALSCFVLALLSKESAVVFLPLALIGDCVRGQWKPASRYWRIAGVTLLYVAVLWRVQGGRFGPPAISILDNPLVALPPGSRILNALRVAWKYVGLQLYPATLSCDYSYNEIPLYAGWSRTLPAAMATLLAMGAWIWTIRKHRPGATLAGGIYIASFATTANIIMPIGTIMAERLAYLPSLGFCLLFASVWNWLHKSHARLALGILAVLVSVFGVRTMVRNRDWQDNRTLYTATVRNAPGSVKAHQDMALAYIDAGRLDQAAQQLETALQIYPSNAQALALYGLVKSRQGNYQEAGRMLEKAFSMTARNDPTYDETAVNLAALYAQTGHLDAAFSLLNRETAESPGYAPAWSKRSVLDYKRNDWTRARVDAETALRLDPADSEAREVMEWLSGLTRPPANGPSR